MKNNILDVTVSRFDNCWSPENPLDVKLLEWLQSDEFRPQIESLRSIQDKATRNAEKRKLPGVTVSGTFSYRKKSSLLQHSGLICIDIDSKENPDIGDFEAVKHKLPKRPNIAYCGLSASGKGLYCIIPIAYPEKHGQHFDALKNVFLKLGINIDVGCREVCRLRGASWDDNPYINPYAIPYTGLYSTPKPQLPNHPYMLNIDSAKQVELLIEEIRLFGIDITGNYTNQWLRIGFALADEFGEAGRAYFHEISQFNSSYSPRVCDDQYTKCLRSHGNGVSISTLFWICKDYGIFLNRGKK